MTTYRKKITIQVKLIGGGWMRENTRAAHIQKWMDPITGDNFCPYCGRSVGEHGIELALDHITPRSIGGDNKPSNIMPVCSTCNSARGNDTVVDFLKRKGYPMSLIIETLLYINRKRRQPLNRSAGRDMRKQARMSFWTNHKGREK